MNKYLNFDCLTKNVQCLTILWWDLLVLSMQPWSQGSFIVYILLKMCGNVNSTILWVIGAIKTKS
jgi:hypothetical protein